MARDRARRKKYWKCIKVARQLSAENLAVHLKPLEKETVANPQIPVVSQPENFGCVDRTSDVSQSYQLQETETAASPQLLVVSQTDISSCVDRTSAVSQLYRHLTSERETVGIAQVNSDLNKLSAETAVEHFNSWLKDCEDSDIECARCLKRGSDTYYVAVQALKASVIVAKTARYQIGPHINGCVNLFNLSSH